MRRYSLKLAPLAAGLLLGSLIITVAIVTLLLTLAGYRLCRHPRPEGSPQDALASTEE